MKILSFLLVFLIALSKTYSQDYDLIVKSNGDPIACHIDSVTVSHIYFEMMSSNQWIHTYIDRENVAEFKHDTINAKQIVFKSGTSIIEEIREPKESLFDLQRNSVNFGVLWILYSLIYERMFPLSNDIGIILGGGFTIMSDFQSGIGASLVGETSLLLGGPEHSIEPGLMIYPGIVMVRIGYRFQGYKGFLLRPAIQLIGSVPLFTFSVGYSF